MRCLNEWLARKANVEDGCTGRFWEGRFKSQALLDDTALLTAMCYVDLNPIRAGIAASPMDSEFTSVQQRLFEIARRQADSTYAQMPILLAFAGAQTNDNHPLIPFNLQDYLGLVDTSGRIIRSDKRGSIPASTPKLLSALGVEPNEWLKTVTQLQARFELFVGAPHRLRAIADKRGWRWVHGLAAGRALYRKAN